MPDIKRYAFWQAPHEDCDGPFIAFVDHEREVAALKAKLEAPPVIVNLKHGIGCPAALPVIGGHCTCGLIYKVMVRGEQALRVDAQKKLAEATVAIDELNREVAHWKKEAQEFSNSAAGELANSKQLTHRVIELEKMTEYTPEMLTALMGYEELDNLHANCENCEGEVQPELCEKCFPFADRNRLQMRAVLKKVRGQ